MKLKTFCVLLLASQTLFALPQVEDAGETSAQNASSQVEGYLSSTGPIATPSPQAPASRNASIQDDLLAKLSAMETLVQQLQGRVDELQHTLEKLQADEAAQFIAIHKKIDSQVQVKPVVPSKVTTPAVSSTSMPAEAPVNKSAVKAAPASPEAQEKMTYDAAYGLISAKAYPDAIDALHDYLAIYPQGKYAANANYWLGELNSHQGSYPEALKYFQVVIDDYPGSSKEPDALLKLGIINKHLGNDVKARFWFNKLLKKYPESQAAKSAKEAME